ncbi:MAG TPA: hypothetical protein VKT70_09790 [Stellaceae bacterium]|nr:hypothetical protein [Stellaceae bacterium]
MASHFLRDLGQILFRNRDQHAIPSMDGALGPNDRLDALAPVGEPLPAPDCHTLGPDGALYVSSGHQVWRLEGDGFTRRTEVARFEGQAGGLAFHPDGRLLVCVEGAGLAAVGAQGRLDWLSEVRGEKLGSLTSVVATPQGTIFMSEGSTRHEPHLWYRDLMEKNRAGRILSCGPGLEGVEILAQGLAYPHGLALSEGARELWFTEAWQHRVMKARIEGRGLGGITPVIPNLPGYPARLGPARDGGFWLAIFAMRTHLTELVLREDEYRHEMMRTIEPDLWIRPALSSSGHYLEPLQGGSVKKLGIQKPWAPPRSYGLVVRIDEEGEAIESLHSRVGGRYHGVTSAGDTREGLIVLSKGNDRVLLRPRQTQ